MKNFVNSRIEISGIGDQNSYFTHFLHFVNCPIFDFVGFQRKIGFWAKIGSSTFFIQKHLDLGHTIFSAIYLSLFRYLVDCLFFRQTLKIVTKNKHLSNLTSRIEFISKGIFKVCIFLLFPSVMISTYE